MRRRLFLSTVISVCYFSIPTIAYATVESSLRNIQTELTSKLLPIAAILGLIVAGFSFVMGKENARNHLVLAVIGAIIGFAAPSIVSLIQQLVR
jgi:type IV secretory pathway VirB2 component (pilin)